MSPVLAPRPEYVTRLADRQAAHTRLTAADARLSYFRLAIFVATVVVGVAASRALVTWWWLCAPLAIFMWLVRRHDVVIGARDEAGRAVLFYERGIARLDDAWSGTGEPGERFADPAHPYAADLDLFGRGSLFELLSIARTRIGEEQLAAWLTRRTSTSGIRQRQAAVEELASKLDLREAVALAGAEVQAGVEADALMTWAEQRPTLRRWMRGVAALLTAASLAGAAIWWLTGHAEVLIVVIFAELSVFMFHRHRIYQVLHAAGGWSRDLDVLAHVLHRIEQDTFSSVQLATLRARLEASGIAPAIAIRRLHRMAEMHDWQHNLLFAIVAIPLLWDVHIAFAMESWRARYGSHVRIWLQSVGEFEALSSLATYRFEHPDDPFAEIEEQETPARFSGIGLGHPLLPAARMVRNDVTLDAATQLLVISGSNMSGKSTLLRTVGINAVLALAGAPVRAASLRLTPLAIGATLRIQDSLQAGRSRFYAEITRIRELADLAATRPPLLFLLDELFHGTNSRDRLVGASGVLRQLLQRGAIGLITTHDLALTAVADQLAPRAVNVHFEDRFESGEILFDYRMKSGPVTRSNAIALMRAVGLDVDLS
jgi:hypothetical protein